MASNKKETETKVEETKVAEAKETDTKVAEAKEIKKIKFLLSPAGKFYLPYNVGQTVELDKKLADEIVEAKYADFV